MSDQLPFPSQPQPAYPPPPPSQQPNPARLVLGIGVILLGLILTLDQFDIAGAGLLLKLSPLLLVAVGVVKLQQHESNNTWGFVLVVAGAFLLLVNFTHGRAFDAFWPLLVVALGIHLVLKALKQRRGVPPDLAQAEGFVSGTALFGGFKRRFAGSGFQGGELTAIFGGFELDLRQAQLGPEPRRLDIFALFGGGSIFVPEGWEVSVNVSSIFGGVDQKNLPVPLGTSGAPRLTITGTALFGGVEIRN